jgi:mannose-6-phosphate isomerase-like protein (cupin superfamily)
MNVRNVGEAEEWFSVLQTSKKTQTAIMTLKPGQSSGKEPEAHKNSEQVLLVLEGEVAAEVDGKRKTLKRRDIIVIPPGTPHKFKNKSNRRCVTFNTYSPPEY